MRSPDFFDASAAAARACRIRACARDRRRGRRTPDVLQKSCCRPHSRGAADRRPRFAARMLLPVGAAFRALARTIEFRTILGRPSRTREARTLSPPRSIARIGRKRGLSKLRAPSRAGREIADVRRDPRASATALNRRAVGRSPKFLRGPRSRRAARENFLSPPNFRSADHRGDDRHRAAAGHDTADRHADGRRLCENLRRAAYRAASRRHLRAAYRASCRRISCRRNVHAGRASPRDPGAADGRRD